VISHLGDIQFNNSNLAYVKKYVVYSTVNSGARVWFGYVYEIINKYCVNDLTYDRIWYGTLNEEEFLLQQLTAPICPLYEA